MKSVQKKIVGLLKVLAMIVAGVLLGAILITLAYCIPVNQTNAQKSIDSIGRRRMVSFCNTTEKLSGYLFPQLFTGST